MSDTSGTDAHWGALALLVGVTGVAALTGALASVRAGDFYQVLSKPTWAPPAQVFGPVWSVLYVLMALAAWLVVRARGWPGALKKHPDLPLGSVAGQIQSADREQ